MRDELESMHEQLKPEEDMPSHKPQLAFSLPPLQPLTHPCGGTGWRTVAYYNMSNPTYACPAGWHYHPPPARGCSRVRRDRFTCDPILFPVSGGPYTQICGRLLGYQFGETTAFHASWENNSITIDEPYVTGVSITRGNPRQHVWTYAVGRNEQQFRTPDFHGYCPCDRSSYIPPYVGTCTYCESGDNDPYGTPGHRLFSDDVLWDGEGCRVAQSRCCQFQGPLYFMTALEEPVNDTLEARICNYYPSQRSNVIVSQLELYVK